MPSSRWGEWDAKPWQVAAVASACRTMLPCAFFWLLSTQASKLPSPHSLPRLTPSPMQVAGYRMHVAYRGQFAKLLQYISDQFLPALATSNDPDARAVYTR